MGAFVRVTGAETVARVRRPARAVRGPRVESPEENDRLRAIALTLVQRTGSLRAAGALIGFTKGGLSLFVNGKSGLSAAAAARLTAAHEAHGDVRVRVTVPGALAERIARHVAGSEELTAAEDLQQVLLMLVQDALDAREDPNVRALAAFEQEHGSDVRTWIEEQAA